MDRRDNPVRDGRAEAVVVAVGIVVLPACLIRVEEGAWRNNMMGVAADDEDDAGEEEDTRQSADNHHSPSPGNPP